MILRWFIENKNSDVFFRLILAWLNMCRHFMAKYVASFCGHTCNTCIEIQQDFVQSSLYEIIFGHIILFFVLDSIVSNIASSILEFTRINLKV